MKWQVSKIWSGVCWIIGGGSSVREQFGIPDDLVPETKEEFEEFGDYLSLIHNDHVIGVNLAAFLGDWVDVAFWGDSSTYLDYKGWFDEFSGLKISTGSKFYEQRYQSIKFLHRNHDKGITTDPSELSWVGKNSGSAAINLAYHLGCTEIRLLGFDMKNHESGRMHFHTGYPQRDYIVTNKDVKEGRTKVPRLAPQDPYKNKFLPGFAKIAKDAEKLGVKIINVSPDSEIIEFPKVSLNDIIDITCNKNIKEPVKQEHIELISDIQEKNNEKIDIRCVLRSGGDYNFEYVHRLKKAIENNTTLDFTFTCLSDVNINEYDGIKIIPLKHDWPGWWSKIELFRPDLPKNTSIYFDLDTLIIGNIDELLNASKIKNLVGLRGFNQGFTPPNGINFASGIMMGDFYSKKDIYTSFSKDPQKYISEGRVGWKHGDQGYIHNFVLTDDRIQNYVYEDYIVGKKKIKKDGIPEKTKVIAWSGKPRFHELTNNGVFNIINQYWKKYE